jgi:CRISPR-associated endonuclease/helicase Cas3
VPDLILRAKSRAENSTVDPPTVAEHCREVHSAAIHIWASIEADLAGMLGVEVDALRGALRPLYLIAALLHDVGKANSAFQALVQPQPGDPKRQPVRHEVLSAMFIADQTLMGKWLTEALGRDEAWALAWIVGGHHLQLRERNDQDKEDPIYRTGNTASEITLHFHDDQIMELMQGVKGYLTASGAPLADPTRPRREKLSTLEDDPDGLEPRIRSLIRESRRAWPRIGRDKEMKEKIALLKALLIAADVAGSALAADGQSVERWIPKSLGDRLTPADLEPVVQEGLAGKRVRPFQTRVAQSDRPATVVMAGCGNGKTTAAYMWAQRWARGKKLFFTYPTTGTASAGFEDYLLAQTHLARTLIHGRAWVDLRAMRTSPEDDLLDGPLRLESLTAWSKQVVACTVDTVLGLIQNQRRPLFSFPAIACGAFVFDEIHNYDRRLFGELLTFLRTFPGVPALLMSASIPPNRLRALREVLGERMGGVIKGDPEQEGIERYRIEMRDSSELCWPDVERYLKDGKKVLWVCNTVRDAFAILDAARARGISEDILKVYHSRFRYRERVERQEEVIARFKSGAGACLAITTQVCEMSLDISADLLVTALPPLPALVQRLGRLNRFAEEDDPWLCLVYPFKGKPYDKQEHPQQIEDARNMIAALKGQPTSQATLAKYIDGMKTQETWVECSTWLEGGWQSESAPAREGDTSLTIIREEDIAAITRECGPQDPKTWTAQRLVPWTLPILADGFQWERRVGPYPLAPRGTVPYDPVEGAR